MKARPLWIGALLAGCALLAWLILMAGGRSAPPPDRPVLALVSSLPLVWGESGVEDIVQGRADPAPAYRALDAHYRLVTPTRIADLDARGIRLLLMAQPPALPPEELAALDNWLHRGGRALILADPALQWESRYPLGDRRRPLFTSLLSPLFAHWGVELVLPMDDPQAVSRFRIDGFDIDAAAPGAFRRSALADTGKDAHGMADCRLVADGFLIDCAIGKGRAIVLADADLMDARLWQREGMLDGLLGGAPRNMEFLLDRLARLSADR